MNIALITVDTLRADHVGCYGYERDTTPNIDELASESEQFTSAIAHACATRPSFPSILTSTHGLLYGGFDHLSDQQTPVAEPLSENGYTTGGFHSNPYLSAQFGYGRGFDTFSDLEEDSSVLSRLRRYVSNNLSGPLHDVLAWAHTKAETHGGVDIGSYYQDASSLTDEALNWVKSAEEPWFLWVHYMDPHHPYVPPEEYQVFGTKHPQRRGIKLRQKVLDDPDSLTEADWSDLVDLYDAEIRYTDAEIGRLMQNIGDATYILTADHGEEFYEHGNFGHKNRFYEEHVHVPLLYGGDSTGVQDDLVGLNDVPVTLLRDADIEVPDSYRGQHLLSGSRESVVGGWGVDRGTDPDRVRLMYRTQDGKYIADRINDTEQFYDLQADPGEQENRIEDVDTSVYESETESFEAEVRKTSDRVEEITVSEDLEERLHNLGYRE